MSAVIGTSFAVLLAIGVPVAFVLGGAALMGILLSPDGASILPAVPQQIFNALDSFPFLTIPLFILAGSIMAEGGVAERLVDLANLTIGRGRGGLASSIVASALFFHGISGSSAADTAGIGKVTLSSLRKQGYPLPFGTALLAAAGATATLIPPSTDLILIGVVANMSIAGLFAAGLIPAAINGLGLMGMVVYLSRRHNYGDPAQPFRLRPVLTAFVKAIPAQLMVVLILGGIILGIFTPTETSAIAVFYGLFLTGVVYRTLTFDKIKRIFRETIEISGIVLLMIAMGSVLSYTLTFFEVPADLTGRLDSLTQNKDFFLLLVQIIFFAISTFMDAVPALLILMPILTPMAISRGVEPIHFGILVESNVALGLALPPVGNCLLTACAVAKIPVERVVKPLIPLIAILIVTMMIITYVEGFSMFLPRLLGLDD